jgi:pullulanase/glycogen debranching enzyme
MAPGRTVLFSEVAQHVVLCLFDQAGRETQVDLPELDGFVWHGYLPGIGSGQLEGPLDWDESLSGYRVRLLMRR